MTISFSTLFSRIGKAVKAAKDLDDTAAATLVTNIRAFEDDLDSEIQDFQQDVLGSLESSLSGVLSSFASHMATLVGNPVSNLIVETVHKDVPLVNKTITTALTELIDQMLENGESLDRSTVSAAVDYGESLSSSAGSGDNYGNGVIVTCTKRGDGRVNEFILAEVIRCEITSVSSNGSAVWQLTAEPSVALLNPDWPGGSGVTAYVTSHIATASNLVTNGGFEDEDDYADGLPNGWTLVAGVLNTDVAITNIEQQTVTVNGSPEGGSYTLSYTDPETRTYTTVPLAYNATSSDVQTALNQLPNLGSVTVSSTGTSPNLTHTITFTGVSHPPALAYTSSLTGGTPTITVAVLTDASAYTVRGARCLAFTGDGATKTQIQVPVSLAIQTCYAVNLWALVDVVPAAGELTIDLVDGDSGMTIDDDQGVANSLAVDLTSLTDAPTPHNTFFHTPLTLPPRVYLRLSLSTALSAGTVLYVDELCMVKGTKLYNGGLYVAAFSGPNDFHLEDYADITVSNDRGGELHEWLNRLLGLASKEILLPTAASATRQDSLIA